MGVPPVQFERRSRPPGAPDPAAQTSMLTTWAPHLGVDMTRSERGWVCCGTVAPANFHPCQTQQIPPTSPTTAEPTANQQHSQHPAQQPPAPGDTNSWFFVPLLLAAARRLHPDAGRQWAQHPAAGIQWNQLVAQLQRVRAASHFSLEQIVRANTELDSTQAWALWLLLPRVLLHRPPNTRALPKDEWRRKPHAFQQVQWHHLLQHGDTTEPSHNHTAPSPTTSASSSPPERRAERARHLVHQRVCGKAGSHSDTAGTRHSTYTGTAPRPSQTTTEPYTALHPNLHQYLPDQQLQLPVPKLLTASRRSRKGAAPGHQGPPASQQALDLRSVLDDDATTALFVDVCQLLAQARIPPNIAKTIGMGRMVALQKPNGGVRGLVIGDVLRRVVSRCIAQMFSSHIHAACSPHQFALSTRAGTGAVLHALTTAATQPEQHHLIH